MKIQLKTQKKRIKKIKQRIQIPRLKIAINKQQKKIQLKNVFLLTLPKNNLKILS